MEMSDSRVIRADRETVFAALLSPEVLQECVPGAQDVTGTQEDGFQATVVQKVGPVKATFKGLVVVSDLVLNEKLTLSGEGKGGAAGFAKGGAAVRLEDHAEGTELFYDVEAKVGGKLAQLGSRIIDGFAKKMADQFFSRFQEVLEAPDAADAAASDTSEGAEASESVAEKKGWLSRIRGS